MAKILCRNCQSLEEFLPEAICQNCQTPYYGYSLQSLPERFRQIMKDAQREESNSEVIEEVSTSELDDVSSEVAPVGPIELGWLIVHTEGKYPMEFPLVEGINYIGRPAEEIRPHIQVPDDQHVSRGHAVLEVVVTGAGCRYKLTDDENNQRGNESLNGTHINGDPERLQPGQSTDLRDGDTLQIGETKLVLKTPEVAGNLEIAKTQVQRMDYEKTIFKRI